MQEPLNCDGCTLCCRGDAIRILPEDDVDRYITVPHSHFPGHRMLAHKPNGHCIYLVSSGCSIQESKPKMCRKLDCRNTAKFKKKDLKRLNVPVRVWARGMRLLGRVV